MDKAKLCFVIGPIGDHKSDDRVHADLLLKKIIRPTFKKHFPEFKVERADDISRPGLIDSQVITNLIEADLVVADLTTRNANAFYELGIRHMLQKPVIHVYRRGDRIPADIAPYRAIEFAYADKWEIRDAKQNLRRAVTQVNASDFYIENPVTRSAGFIRMQQRQPNRKKTSTVAPRKSSPHAPKIGNVDNLTWTEKNGIWTATWVAPRQAVSRGYRPKWQHIWQGRADEIDSLARIFIIDQSEALQTDLINWIGTGMPDKST